MTRKKEPGWLDRYLLPICKVCGTETNNKSRICTICRQTCSMCGLAKSYHAKICLSCRKKDRRKRGKHRQRRQHTKRRSIPTSIILRDGTEIQTRSMLEASWILELQHCAFLCYECRPVPCKRLGKFGPFVGSYLPDLLLRDSKGDEFLCELKPTMTLANEDTRPERALALDPLLRFIIIGGEPHEPGGFFVKLLTSEGVKTYQGVSLYQLMNLLGCGQEGVNQ